jgi:Uncharacterized homolog of the cytoplasmic domain of flagellar protein FhlB
MSQFENTQRAAALKYNADSPQNAPVVVASGLGYTAQKIIDLAQDNDIPIYQDDALASLLSQMNAGSEIPPELYQAVVDIYVYFLNYNQEAATAPQAEIQAENQPEP